jgi:hypothetical protein
MKVYIVFNGVYSDRGVEAVFDNKEAADNFIENAKPRNDDGSAHEWDSWDVEEWDMNTACPASGRTPWRLQILKNGDLIYAGREPNGASEIEYFHTIWHEYVVELGLDITVNARSKEHAIKIAGERRAQHIAMGTWKDA